MFFSIPPNNHITTYILLAFIFVSCSKFESKQEPNVSVSTNEPPRQKIRVLEDTVYINKSGGKTFMHLLSPNKDSVVIINNDVWLECLNFRANNDAIPTQYSEIKALNNPNSTKRIGSVFIKYKNDSNTPDNKLMDTVVVVQLATNDVLDTENKYYTFDEFEHIFSIYSSISEFDASIKNTTKGWIQDITRASNAKTKFTFTMQALPFDEDSLTGRIEFSDPLLTPQAFDYASPLFRTANILQRRSIIIENKISMLKEGSSHTLQLNLIEQVKSKDIKFFNTNKDVATISESGCITGLSKGEDTIIVTTKDNKYKVSMPIKIGNENIYGPDNRVKFGLGVTYSSSGMSFFASIENKNETKIHVDSLFIYNNSELQSIETSENKLGDLEPNQKKIISFYFPAPNYKISCRIKYMMDSNKYELKAKDEIIINNQ